MCIGNEAISSTLNLSLSIWLRRKSPIGVLQGICQIIEGWGYFLGDISWKSGSYPPQNSYKPSLDLKDPYRW